MERVATCGKRLQVNFEIGVATYYNRSVRGIIRIQIVLDFPTIRNAVTVEIGGIEIANRRYGGRDEAEYMLQLPKVYRGVGVVVGRCLTRIRALTAPEDTAKTTRVDASIGAATFPTSGVSNVDQLLAAADLARDRASAEPTAA